MKHYYIAAAAIAMLNIALYPLMRHLAYLERGYLARGGGEDILFIFGFIAAFLVVSHGRDKKRQTVASSLPTESEQSEQRSAAISLYHKNKNHEQQITERGQK